MAEKNRTRSGLKAADAEQACTVPDSVPLPEARFHLALEAAWEIEALMEVVIREVGPSIERLAVRGMCIRASQLSCAIMSLLDDKLHETADLYRKVHGAHRPKQEVAHG